MGYLVLSGETNVVSNSIGFKYNVKNALADELECLYDITGDIIVGDTIEFIYNGKIAVSEELDVEYDVRCILGDTIECLYDIQDTGTIVSNSFEALWDVRNAVGETIRFEYDIPQYTAVDVWDGDLEVDVALNVEATVNSDGTVDLLAKQGATWALTLTILQSDGVTPMDLTDYTVRGMIRRRYNSAEETESFTCALVAPATDGQFTATISDDDTAAIPAKNYVYDLEIESPAGDTTRVLQGKLKVDPEVTK